MPYNGGTEGFQAIPDVLNYWVTHNNTSADPVVTDITSNIENTRYEGGDEGVSVDHYKITNGAHVWFEQNFGGSDLNTLIWNFLSTYDLNGLRS